MLISNLAGKPEYELMQTAWRERNPEARIKAAKEAIGLNPECATAYILLAEEEAGDISEADTKLREAYRIAETNHRRSQQLQHQSNLLESQHRRDTNVMIYIRRRLAMCARKLGKLKEVLERTNSIFFHLLDSQIPSVLHFIAIKVRLAFLCEAALPNCNTKPVSVLVHVSATTGCPNKFEIKTLIKTISNLQN